MPIDVDGLQADGPTVTTFGRITVVRQMYVCTNISCERKRRGMLANVLVVLYQLPASPQTIHLQDRYLHLLREHRTPFHS